MNVRESEVSFDTDLHFGVSVFCQLVFFFSSLSFLANPEVIQIVLTFRRLTPQKKVK